MEAKRISNGEFPEEGQYVLGYLKKDNWCDESDTLDNRYFKVVQFSPCEPSGNNQTPYEWREFGPSTYFGHEIDVWYSLDDYDRD